MARMHSSWLVELSGRPVSQSYYRRRRGSQTWHLVPSVCCSPPNPLPSTIDIVSWCVGHNLPLPQARIIPILNIIQSTCQVRIPGIIFLQDVHISALDSILTHPWVTDCFSVTDVDGAHWVGDKTFGMVALIRRNLDVRSIFRVPLLGEVGRGRDALVLDFEDTRGQIVRFMSTHLGNWRANALLMKLCEYSPALGSDAEKFIIIGEMGVEVRPPRCARLSEVFMLTGDPDEESNGCSWGLNAFPRIRAGERRQKAHISEGLFVGGFITVGAGRSAPMMVCGGTAGYASENYGVILTLRDL